jgi:hypothetical protein
MRVVAVVPTYRRKEVTIAAVKALRTQSVPPEAIIVVGSERGDIEVAAEAGAYYVDHPNYPLSWKIQAGILQAKCFYPEGLLLSGSDDFLSRNWIEVFSQYVEEFDMIGHGIVHMVAIDRGVPLVVRLEAYKGTDRCREPIGAGRLFSRRILDRLGWNLFPEGKERGCDAVCFAQLRAANARVFRYENDDVKLLCPKGGWAQINPWSAYEGANHRTKVIDPEVWLNRFFPGVAEFLLKMREAQRYV